MVYLKLGAATLEQLHEVVEFGMDFYVVQAESNNSSINGPYFIRSNGIAIPRNSENRIYDFDDLVAGNQFPINEEGIELTYIKPMDIKALSIMLPLGYVQTRGAYPLLGTTTLAYDTRFIRFTSSSTDQRFINGNLLAGTYLTSVNDALLVNTGFGVVGRYALPLPVSAKYKHDYIFPKGTVLQVGTVAPNYGQAGGGVEVYTTSNVSIVHAHQQPALDDY